MVLAAPKAVAGGDQAVLDAAGVGAAGVAERELRPGDGAGPLDADAGGEGLVLARGLVLQLGQEAPIRRSRPPSGCAALRQSMASSCAAAGAAARPSAGEDQDGQGGRSGRAAKRVTGRRASLSGASRRGSDRPMAD